MLRAKKSAVVELTIKQARYVYDTLGDSVGNSLMAQLADRLGPSVMRRGIMWRTGDDRLSISLMHAAEMNEMVTFVGYLIRSIEEAPFEVDAYRIYISAEADIRCCTPAFSGECRDAADNADRDRMNNGIAFPSPVHGRLALASVNRIPVHVGQSPARISIWGSTFMRLQSSIRLPRHGQLAVDVMTRVLDQEVKLSGRVIWAGFACGDEYEYGIELQEQEPAYRGGFSG